VLSEGVFYAASQLFGIRFAERTDIPVYHPDVRVWEIFDQNDEGLALFYGDFFARDSKSGGAWMGNFIEQSTLLSTKPVIYNVCNYQKPAAGQTALLSWDDVITLFHEFGHTLHGLFARQRYASLSGTNTPRDFVEFPSQINEHWASHPEVFTRYARHYQTGEPMPEALRNKMLRSTQFNKGYDMTELLSAALLDMNWHSLDGVTQVSDVDAFEAQAIRREGLDIARYRPVIAAATSPISSAVVTQRVITPICGRKCWRTMASSGLWSRAVYPVKTGKDSAKRFCRVAIVLI
jgi:peptidyl-dipeptidase Dcp